MQDTKEKLKTEESLGNVTGGTGILGTETGDILKTLKDIRKNSTVLDKK